MPVIRIDYDGSKVNDGEAKDLSNATQEVVSRITGIEDVFVYANSSHIRVKIAPVEIFIQMSESKIKDLDDLTNKIKSELSSWKIENNFKHKINMSVIPMNWKIEIDI